MRSTEDTVNVTLQAAAGQAPEAASENEAFDPGDWKSRIIVARALGAATQPPAWLDASYETLREQVMHPDYPCFFGTMAEKRGEMFYSYVNGKDTRDLPATMQTFAELALRPEYRKNNIAVFFEPDAEPLSHEAYHQHFWQILQHLHDVDPDPEADLQPPPSDGAWEFSFAGVQTFVVCACPSFRSRHSRNLGPGMVLLFQPRAVFVDTITNKVIGREARNQVRKRLLSWDDLPAHPDLGFYGDEGNLEWKQYFLDDANDPIGERCPFLKRQRQNAEAAAAAGLAVNAAAVPGRPAPAPSAPASAPTPHGVAGAAHAAAVPAAAQGTARHWQHHVATSSESPFAPHRARPAHEHEHDFHAPSPGKRERHEFGDE